MSCSFWDSFAKLNRKSVRSWDITNVEENFALQLETICFGEEERRQIGKVSLNAKHRIKRIVTDNASINKKDWLIGFGEERRKYMQIVEKNVHWKVIKTAFRIHCHPKRRRFKPLSSSLELTTVFDRDNYSPASQFFSFHFVWNILRKKISSFNIVKQSAFDVQKSGSGDI